MWVREVEFLLLLLCFVFKHRGHVTASQLSFAGSGQSVAPENCDVNRIEQEIFCQLAETGHMLQSDVQELEKQEQGNFVYSIKGRVGSHFEEQQHGPYCLLTFSQFACLKLLSLWAC